MGEREFTKHQIRKGAAYPRLIERMTRLADNADRKDDGQRISQCVFAVILYLQSQDAPYGAVEPLATLMDAFGDISDGLHSEVFKPKKKKSGHLPNAFAHQMGMAALVVSAVPDDMRKDTLTLVADKLCVTEARLENFKKNLFVSDGRIKSFAAHVPFIVYTAQVRLRELCTSDLEQRTEEFKKLHDSLTQAATDDAPQRLERNLPYDPVVIDEFLSHLKPVPKKYRRRDKDPR